MCVVIWQKPVLYDGLWVMRIDVGVILCVCVVIEIFSLALSFSLTHTQLLSVLAHNNCVLVWD